MIDVTRNNKTSDVEFGVTVKSNVKVSPEDIAIALWLMDDQQQVEMLNKLSQIAQYGPLAMQLQSVTDNDDLTFSARMFMEQIGNYSRKEL